MPKLFSKKEIKIVFAVFLLIIILSGFFTYKQLKEIGFNNSASEQKIVKINLNTPKEIKPITVEIKAKSAYVKNLNTGQILYQKNENQKMPLASLTKIMTALVAKKNGDDNRLVKINQRDLAMEGEYFLSDKDIFKLKDLINMSMVASINDTASAITSILGNKNNFIKEMNLVANQIGMKNSLFKNETGLDLSTTEPGSVGTAKDMTSLIEYVFKNYPEIFEKTKNTSVTSQSLDGKIYKFSNTDELVPEISGLLASKTGYTDIAGGNLALVVDVSLNEPISIVILGSTNSITRFDDAKKILENIKHNL